MKSLLAFLRLTGLLIGTLLVLGFSLVPFTSGVVLQALSARRPSWFVIGLLGTVAFLVAWLALDNVPLSFLRQPGASWWPSLVLGWLFSMASCAYASFLVRALWPQRFADRPPVNTSPQTGGQDKSFAVAGSVPLLSANVTEPLGFRDLQTTVSALRYWIPALKKSVIAFVTTLVLGFASMGFLGIALYYSVAPVLWLRFAPEDRWHGDWVWPAIIGVGMAWSVSFLIAGVANHFLVRRRLRASLRRLAYLGILWLWALLVWTLTLMFAPNQPPL